MNLGLRLLLYLTSYIKTKQITQTIWLSEVIGLYAKEGAFAIYTLT